MLLIGAETMNGLLKLNQPFIIDSTFPSRLLCCKRSDSVISQLISCDILKHSTRVSTLTRVCFCFVFGFRPQIILVHFHAGSVGWCRLPAALLHHQ